jgi:superfamily II DNA or RNA helicase
MDSFKNDKLRPASFLTSIYSRIFPRSLQLELHVEEIPSGEIKITRRWMSEGKEIHQEFVQNEKLQHVMGHSLIMPDSLRKFLEKMPAMTVTKKKADAARFLARMEDLDSVQCISALSGREITIEEIKPEIYLDLNEDKSMNLNTKIESVGSTIFVLPTDFNALRLNEGWFFDGDSFRHVGITDPVVYQYLDSRQGSSIVPPRDVPKVLKYLELHEKEFKKIEKAGSLKDLGVTKGKDSTAIKISGGADAISINSSFIASTEKGNNYVITDDQIANLLGMEEPFVRVDEGWIQLSPTSLMEYQKEKTKLNEDFGDLRNITGEQIPEAICTVVQANQKSMRGKSPWNVYMSQAVKDAHRILDFPSSPFFKLSLVESDGLSLISMSPFYRHDTFQLSHQEIDQLKKQSAVWARKDNAWLRIDKKSHAQVSEKIKELDLRPGEMGFEFPASQKDRVVEVFSVLGSFEHTIAYANFLEKLEDFTKIDDVALPNGLNSSISLRPYQKHGFNWLAFLQKFQLNGILADDMGLGKTLQTLAVIQRTWENSSQGRPSLIIAPTSVVGNWEAEIKKFLHNVIVIRYIGENRKKRIQFLIDQQKELFRSDSHIIVITSFDSARMDLAELDRIDWSYVVVDEAHFIKNPDAKRTLSIKKIRSMHRLALTGTPIQNNLEELWSLFDFAMPNYLGTRAKFKQKYGTSNRKLDLIAVMKGKDSLKDKVYPFVLRRMKEQVATDLPEKNIIDKFVDLTKYQAHLYRELVESADCSRVIRDAVQGDVVNVSPQFLALLGKLRGLCNHPVLSIPDASIKEIDHALSGKLMVLEEMMEEIVSGGHRVLIFSQYTRMLDIIQELFAKWNIGFLRLDGQTAIPQRMVLVNEFNSNDKYTAFLISTKAGGAGLNLTGADTVIFVDHDWNPANDRQAQDRAYRIGQTRPVTIYRLISTGTIEEKIIQRQEAKQTIADLIIGTDEQGFKNFTKEELVDLFTFKADEG